MFDKIERKYDEYVTSNESIKIVWYGFVKIYRNWIFLTRLYDTAQNSNVSTFLFEWDTLRVTYGRYDSSYWCSATVTFS